jgi:hypothetical protein
LGEAQHRDDVSRGTIALRNDRAPTRILLFDRPALMPLTLPAARAIVTEIFTALLFAQKPAI